MQSASGKIQLEDTQTESLSAHSASGDISLCRLEADGPLRIETASGKILLEDTRGDTLSVTTASGNVFLSRTQVQGAGQPEDRQRGNPAGGGGCGEPGDSFRQRGCGGDPAVRQAV